MFGVLFGFVCLALALIVREWAGQEEDAGNVDGAKMLSIVSVGLIFLASMFVVIGAVGI